MVQLNSFVINWWGNHGFAWKHATYQRVVSLNIFGTQANHGGFCRCYPFQRGGWRPPPSFNVAQRFTLWTPFIFRSNMCFFSNFNTASHGMYVLKHGWVSEIWGALQLSWTKKTVAKFRRSTINSLKIHQNQLNSMNYFWVLSVCSVTKKGWKHSKLHIIVSPEKLLHVNGSCLSLSSLLVRTDMWCVCVYVVWYVPKKYYIYIYIYTLGAGGSPKVLWVGYCECSKIVISLWWNVNFWRSHFLHRMVFCADEIFLIRALIDEKSIIHTFILVRNVWFVW